MRLDKARGGFVINNALVGELAHIRNAVHIPRNPIQRVEIAQSAFVFLNVGLEAIT